MGRDVSTHKELPRWTRNWPRQVLQLSCYQKKFNCYHTMNSLCLLDFIISHQEIILLPLSFCWSLWLLSFSQPPPFGKFQRFLTQARFTFFFQLSAPFSWLPHILSRGNNGKWKPLCINGSLTPRESGGGGGDNKLRWKYSDGGALIITFQPLPSSQSHPGGYSLLCPIRCSALCILICWCTNVSEKEIFSFFNDNYSRQVKSNPYKRHVFCSAIPVTSRSTISI